MNIRNESRSGSLFFWLGKRTKVRSNKCSYRAHPNKCSLLGAGAGHAWISCRSYAIRPGALYEQAFAAGDTPGSVGRGAGAARGRTNTRAKIRLFFLFFFTSIISQIKCRCQVFFGKFFKKIFYFFIDLCRRVVV